jgi:hypothetical protein
MDQWSGLSHLHRNEDALAVAQEALEWARTLPEEAPAYLLPVLLLPMHGLTSTLGALGQDREAVVAGTAAVALARRVLRGRDDPHLPAIAAELPNLGDLLHLLGKSLAGRGRHRRAVRVFAEAVGVYRAQARQDPASVAVERANLDTDLAVSLSELNRPRAAHSVIRRAERAYRALVTADRGTHLAGLTMCLGNVAAICLELDDRAAANVAAREATALARETTPDELGTALVNQACITGAEDLAATVAALAEALTIAEDEDDPELRDWALSELDEHPRELVEPLWRTTSPRPMPTTDSS